MQCNKLYLRSLAVLVLLLLLSVGQHPAEAGNGLVEQAPGSTLRELDLTVYLFEIPLGGAPEVVENWGPVFRKYAEKLYDATEGQVRLRKVTFTTSPSLMRDADIRVMAATGGTDPACAAIGGFKKTNQCITIYPRHMRHTGAVLGQFGLVHESGHYLFGLDDEYKGCAHAPSGDICADGAETIISDFVFCSGTDCTPGGRGGSIMDGGSDVPCKNERCEFCCDNEGPFKHLGVYTHPIFGLMSSNQHQFGGGLSCWSAMASMKAPLRLDALPSDTDGPVRQVLVKDFKNHPEGGLPTFQYIDARLGVVLVLDQSTSMRQPATEGGSTTKLKIVQRGARDAVNYIYDGERFGAVTFGAEMPEQVVPFQSMRTARAVALGAIDRMVAEGQTSMGDALRVAYDMVKPASVSTTEAAGRAIILLSDGLSNGGEDPLKVLEDIKKESLITVHTVALGSQPNDALLKKIADETGGTFHEVDAVDEMPGVLAKIVAAARGEGSIDQFSGKVAPGTLAVFSTTVPDSSTDGGVADDDSDITTFLLTYPPDADLKYSLEMPSRRRVVLVGERACVVPADQDAEPNAADCDSQGITATRTEQQVIYRVPNAEAGVWSVRVENAATPQGPSDEGVAFDFDLVGGDRGTCITATIDHEEDVLNYPDPMRVVVAVYKNGPVGGAKVTGHVRHPDGSIDGDDEGEAGIELFDDGLRVHGDDHANDGIYSGLYSRFSPGGNGDYVFTLKVVNETGIKAGTREDTIGVRVPVPVPPFQATVTATALVRGVPDILTPAQIEIIGPGQPQVLEIDVADISATPVLTFQVKALKEYVLITSLRLNSSGPGDETTIDELALFLDTDRDGVIDSPSSPQARAVFDADDGTALFAGPDVIALIPPGETWHFIIAVGSLNAPTLEELGAGFAPLLRLPAPSLPGGGGPLLGVLALLAVLAVLALRVLDVRLQPVARPLGLALCLTLSILLVGVVGCGGGGDCEVPPPEKPVEPGVYTMVLAAQDVRGVGATTRMPVQGQGEAVQANFLVK